MLLAAERVLAEGARGVALLFVVGEERNSLGAYTAAKHNRGSKFIINGEPTENQLALGSKGALRYEVTASGRMAHSAYPELGESAINKLLDALQRMRQVPMPVNEILGPSTLNIGVIAGGRAPNVISDHAKAEILIRLVDDGEAIKQGIREAAQGEVDVAEVVCIPALHLGAVEGFRTTVVSYTTDIPAFQGAWGQPYLIGPGTIHVAHTSEERVPKRELVEAVELYSGLVRRLLQ
jgi:acetylornithine deacetylase